MNKTKIELNAAQLLCTLLAVAIFTFAALNWHQLPYTGYFAHVEKVQVPPVPDKIFNPFE